MASQIRRFSRRGSRRGWTPCGCYTADGYLPQVKIDAHTKIIQYASKTVCTQTFVNPSKDEPVEEINYVFPLYDGVSVVAFKCTIGDRIINAVVKEREEANEEYSQAQSEGKTAVLLSQSLKASDVFAMSLGNMPPGATAVIEITCLWELKHDAEIDGIRFTIPTTIAPRYGQNDGVEKQASDIKEEGISITIDIDMTGELGIKSIQSPSHPISVTLGGGAESSSQSPLGKGSVTLSQSSTSLDRDFVLEVVANQHVQPVALLETHPTIPNQHAIMATLVPKFKLPAERPEIVFLCDRSGSMGGRDKMTNLIAALNIFLKSLPVGTAFNICSFGEKHSFLWPKSKTYSQETLEEAVQHVATFAANYGGTEVYAPMKATFEQRLGEMNLEVFLLTDGQIWDQEKLFTIVNESVAMSGNKIRVFTLGIGSGASTALIEGVARAGNGFAQLVQDSERMSKKVIRMLKAALLPHINDYSLVVKYEEPEMEDEEDFEIIENVIDSPSVENFAENEPKAKKSELEQRISLFDPGFDDEEDCSTVDESGKIQTKGGHLPTISVPRCLQTPSRIPELYPFSRTTVYVMISDSAPNRKPKSILLKATSRHGPLELEIPLVKLAEDSSTIHQLAARTEIRELEDGRGWLKTAKDSSGRLLKEKFQGRFSELVEREAVRLGVKFQVGGKWASFVGVEELKNGPADQKKRQVKEIRDFKHQSMVDRNSLDQDVQRCSLSSQPPRQGGLGGATSMRRLGDNAVPSEGTTANRSVTGAFGAAVWASATSLQAAEVTSGQTSDPRPTPETACEPASDIFAAELKSKRAVKYDADFLLKFRNVPTGNPVPEFNKLLQDNTSGPSGSDPSQSLGGLRPASRVVGMPMGAFGAPPGRTLPLARFSAPQAVMPLFASHVSLPDDGSTSPRHRTLRTSGVDPEDKLQAIVALQGFTGSWAWDEKLEQILGVTFAAASELQLPDAVLKHTDKVEILATCCAIIFIKTKLKDDVEIWEMLMEKAENWLEDQVGGDAERLLAVVSSLF